MSSAELGSVPRRALGGSARYPGLVRNGTLSVLQRALVGTAQRDQEQLSFQVDAKNAGHSFVSGARTQEGSVLSLVPTLACDTLVQALPRVPAVVKVDLEGYDARCVEALLAQERLPPLLSLTLDFRWVEAQRALLVEQGYRHGKVVAQKLYCGHEVDLAGNPQGRLCGSGPVGDDAVDLAVGPRWRPLGELLADEATYAAYLDPAVSFGDWADIHFRRDASPDSVEEESSD